jgi:hypothetical protein
LELGKASHTSPCGNWISCSTDAETLFILRHHAEMAIESLAQLQAGNASEEQVVFTMMDITRQRDEVRLHTVVLAMYANESSFSSLPFAKNGTPRKRFRKKKIPSLPANGEGAREPFAFDREDCVSNLVASIMNRLIEEGYEPELIWMRNRVAAWNLDGEFDMIKGVKLPKDLTTRSMSSSSYPTSHRC